MSNIDKTEKSQETTTLKWFEKPVEEWNENDEYEALCDLFETHH